MNRVAGLLFARAGAAPAAGTLEWRDRRIAAIAPGDGGALAVLPALANAHDHGRGLRSTAFGAGDRALEAWIPALLMHPALPPYLVAAISHARLAQAGYGAVAHFHQVQDPARLDEEAAEVARAARAVGIRIAFIVPMRDRNRIGYGPDAAVLAHVPASLREAAARRYLAPVLPPEEQVARVERIAAAIEDPLVSVQFGPVGPQWCSDELLGAIARRSAATGRRIHMHLLETRYQREWADAACPGGLVTGLDALGLLSERLTVAHGVWLTAAEGETLARRGVTLSLNASSNLRLRSGTLAIGKLLRAGLRFAVGGDGLPLDDLDDALQQLRVTGLIHAGVGFEPGLDTAALLRAGCGDGMFTITGRRDFGTLEPGAPADFVALDWAALADAVPGTFDPAELLLARARAAHVREVVVAGRRVVGDGAVLGVDLPALEAELRARVADLADALRAALPLTRAFQDSLAAFYRSGGHCRF